MKGIKAVERLIIFGNIYYEMSQFGVLTTA